MPALRVTTAAAALATLAAATAVPAASPAAPRPAAVERVVVIMRHGVRPPTKSQPTPPGVARDPWPAWPVGWGELTPHGAAAVRALAESDREAWRAQGVLPTVGCPAAGAVDLYADSDQRTIATARVVAETLAPGCGLQAGHHPQGEADPLFSPVQQGAVDFDPRAAAEAVATHGRSVATRERHARPLLARLQAVLNPDCAAACPLLAGGSRLAPPAPRTRPKLQGPLDYASTAAQVLLLEYAEGKPLSEVGWGRATAADVTRLSALHALEFDTLTRPRYVASRVAGPLLARIRAALDARAGPALTILVGHDTDIAALGGLFDLHWRIEGFAADDPSPGGELVFERLRGGRVRVLYRAFPLDGIRNVGSGAPPRAQTVVVADDLSRRATWRDASR